MLHHRHERPNANKALPTSGAALSSVLSVTRTRLPVSTSTPIPGSLHSLIVRHPPTRNERINLQVFFSGLREPPKADGQRRQAGGGGRQRHSRRKLPAWSFDDFSLRHLFAPAAGSCVRDSLGGVRLVRHRAGKGFTVRGGMPTYALPRTRSSRSGCNPCLHRAGSLSLGRSALLNVSRE